MVMMPYTPKYYLEYMEQCGMEKARDLFAYISVIRDVSAGGRLERLASGVKAKVPGLTVRPADMKNFHRELEVVKEIYKLRLEPQLGIRPHAEEEIESMAKRLKPLIAPELLIMAEVNGDPAAFFMAVPDYNQVLRRVNGRLGPVGLLKFLWYSGRSATSAS